MMWSLGHSVLTFFDLYHFNGHQIFNSAKGTPETLLTQNSVMGNPLPGIDLMRGEGLGEHRIAMGNYGGAFRNASNVLAIESIGGYNRTTPYCCEDIFSFSAPFLL